MFSLPPSFLPCLRQYVKEVDGNPNLELEFRFSTVENVSRNGWKAFEPVVDAATFQRTLAGYLGHAAPESITREVVHEYIYPSQRITKSPKGEVLRAAWKRNLQKRDIQDYNFRVSLSTEDPVIANDTPDNLIMIRKKSRVTIHDQVVKYDFTTVWTQRMGPSEQHGKLAYEVEIEYVGSLLPWTLESKTAFLVDSIHNFLAALQNSPIVLSLDEKNEILDQYQKLLCVPTRRFIGAQPQTLHRRDLPLLRKGYAVAVKMDGDRGLLIVADNEEVFLMDRRLRVTAVGLIHGHRGTIMDVEVSEGKYHAFDILAYKGKDLRGDAGYCLRARMDLVAEIVQGFKGSLVFVKPHLEDVDAVVQGYQESDGDGLIFTPMNEPYPRGPTWSSLLKWKPESQNSIDFQIMKSDRGWDITVLGAGNSLIRFSHAPLKQPIPVEIQEGAIIECAYDRTCGMMVLLRVREDKLRPNFISVANDIWESIQCPVQLTDLISTAYHRLRKAHNAIKLEGIRNAITLVGMRNPSALDLACGRGGDLFKFSGLSFSRYTGVDVNKEFLAEALRRTKRLTLPCSFHQADLRDVVLSLPEKYDIISCHFALHYFWESDSTWSIFMQNLVAHIKVGGVFICALFDGMRVMRTLYGQSGKRTDAAGKGFSLTPTFDSRTAIEQLRDREFGLGLDVTLHGDHGLILQEQTREYLVFSDQLVSQMAKRNFILKSSAPFPIHDDLDLVERHLSSLNRYYTFQYTPETVTTRRWTEIEKPPGMVAEFPVFVQSAPIEPYKVLHDLTGRHILEHFNDLNLVATFYNVLIHIVDEKGKVGLHAPAPGKPGCDVEPLISLWFSTRHDGVHSVAYLKKGQYHLRFPVASGFDESPSSESSLDEPGPPVEDVNMFLGRPLDRSPTAWKVVELKALAQERGISLPSTVRRKSQIVECLR